VGETHTVTCSSFLNLTVKTALKSVIIDEVTDKTMLVPFMAHCVHCTNKKHTGSTHRYDDHNIEVVLVT